MHNSGAGVLHAYRMPFVMNVLNAQHTLLGCHINSSTNLLSFVCRGRDFFKLGRIDLRCEVSPNNIIVVDAQEDTAPDLSIVDDSDSPSPAPDTTLTEDTMEVDSRSSSAQHAAVHPGQQQRQHECHQSFQPLQQMKVNRQSLPPPSMSRSPTTLAPLQSVTLKAPSNPLHSASPAVRPHETFYDSHPSPREPSLGLTSRKDLSQSQVRSPSELHHVNGSTYPRPPGDVSLNAIERLQTQISQNSGALAAHTRDIRRGEESFQALEATLRREFAAQVQHQAADIQRVDEAVTRLHLEMQGMRQALETVSHEIAINRAEMQRGAAAPPGLPTRVPNAALELMAQQVAVMSHKTSELDNLRVTVEIMKEKIYSLEQGAKTTNPTPTSKATQHVFQPLHGPPLSQPHNTASVRTTPAVVSRARSPVQTPSNPPTYQSIGAISSSTMPEVADRAEPTPSQSAGWASINAGTKRMHMAGVETPREGAVHVPGSPKRQKMAAVDPQASFASTKTPTVQQLHERRDSENPDQRPAAPPSTLPSQHSLPQSSLASQTLQSVYAPFATQDGPSDDSWRPTSQRIIEHRPRGRGRGGGPGSRGGRVRKSMPAQVHHLVTPEWERDDRQGVSESQADPEGYYNHVAHSGRGIARRGSGGGGRGGYAQSERAASLGSQGVSPGFSIGSPNDPYAHTKKTRTKPIRNADGVLIRKDGRPDMRSQSSAANLRKVHARKEGELSTQGSPTGFTPTNLHHSASADAPDTPSPSGYTHYPNADAPSSVQRKHSAIMGKMFPSGLDESRRQNDYAHQVFEEDRDHTAHHRNQNHQSAQKESSVKVKKEQFEQRRASETDGANDEDVDMDFDEEQQSLDANTEEQGIQDGEPVVLETQAVETEMESEATLTAETSTLQ
jgi:hypothetical protein